MTDFEKLDALYDYIENKKNQIDIDEKTYNILEYIQTELSNVIYKLG